MFHKSSTKIFFVAVAVSGLFLFSACGSGDDANIESVFPEDSVAVFVLDYSNDEQVAKFKDLLNQFPETDLGEKLLAEINANEKEGEPTYEEDIKPILEGEWKVAFAVHLDKSVDSIEKFEEVYADGVPEIYFAGEFSEADKIEELTNTYASDLVYEEVDDAKYWTKEETDVYMARYDNVFFITTGEEYRTAAVERLKNGEGLMKDAELKSKIESLGQDNMGYMFVDFERVGVFFEEIYSSVGFGTIADYFANMGTIYGVWTAEEDGMKVLSTTQISGNNVFDGNPDYKLSLFEKVPAEGVFSYMEEANFEDYLEVFVEGFAIGYNNASYSYYPYEEEPIDPEAGKKFYQDFLADLADSGNISIEELQSVLNSPFAFAMSDVDTYYPTMSLYLQLDDETAETGKKLTGALDGFIDEMIVEFDVLVEEGGIDGEGIGALKRDVELVGGGGLHKVYLDWSAFSQETLASMAVLPNADITDIVVELYYGVTGDNMMIFALYPNLAEAYGKGSLADDEVYKEATAKLGDNYGYIVSYFRPAPLINLFTKYLEIADSFGVVPPEVKSNYDLYAKQFIPTFKYFITSGKVVGNELRSDTFFGIERVEAEE